MRQYSSHQYPSSQKRQPRSYKKQRKRNRLPLIMLTLLIFTCAIAWFVGWYVASGSPVHDDISTRYASDDLGQPTQADYLGEPPAQPSQEQGQTASATNAPTSYDTSAQTLSFAQLTQISNDRLLLVNSDYAVPDDIAGNLVRIADYVSTLNTDMLLNEDALAMLRVMFDSASVVGFNQFRVTQGFRSHEYQQSLYDQMPAGIAAPPGHSEHQVGLAVDISYHGVNIGNSMQGDWLMAHSYRYGFILRYPQHKTHITGVPFEPWHYRYVGQPHAYFMARNDMVLEEYIEHLRANGAIAITFEGREFTVSYLSCEDDSVQIPEGHQFWASRDNTGGIIVTVAKSY